MSSSQAVAERPAPLPPTTNDEGEPIQQRTVQQQQKSDNALKQQRREQGLQSNRSRSSSRRDRRKRIQQKMRDGEYMHTNSLEALEEADANGELMAMQPFERIGPDSTSMDGPVTHARAMRGEIPVRGSNPNQPYYMTPKDTGHDVRYLIIRQ
jgi:anti-sigma28 factor (negative regulator of flagellin synthesis)